LHVQQRHAGHGIIWCSFARLKGREAFFMTDRAQGILYHLPASQLRGDALLPLRQLQTDYPDLYERHVRKYADRPHHLHSRVEPLDCTWADVVFLAPVHPLPLFRAMGSSRIPEPWTLDAALLDPARTVIRLMRHGQAGHYPDPHDEHDYLPFTTAGLRAVSRVTQAALDRLERLQPGDPVLPWVDVPHILHRGSIPFDWFQ
jgi:hypothetical protein